MKRFLTWALALVLALSLTAFAEGANGYYQKGDKIEDFAAALSDGTEVTLYGLLAEKKAVLINFWASWCQPCRMEFPYMQKAYSQVSDDIGVLALSVEPTDTAETVNALKDELGLITLPMGVDENGVSARFNLEGGIPYSVLVDRNGVMCFDEVGAITDETKFLRLFEAYTAEDYGEPRLLDDIPKPLPTAEWPLVDAFAAALGAQEMRVELPEDESVWPFAIGADGTGIRSTNGAACGTTAAFAVKLNANAGEALAFEYEVDCKPLHQGLRVYVDGEQADEIAGTRSWSTRLVKFETDGEHTVDFAFQRDEIMDGEPFVALRAFEKADAARVAALEAARPAAPKTLAGDAATVEVAEGELKKAVLSVKLGDLSSSEEYDVVQTGALTLRVRIGRDVNEELAFVADEGRCTMLGELETDESGYLYPVDLSRTGRVNLEGRAIGVCACIIDRGEGLRVSDAILFQPSESAMDAAVDALRAVAVYDGNSGDTWTIDWAYADGSPKQGTSAAAEATAEYRIRVTEADGKPVAGAMVKICDADTCRVETTDENGEVRFDAARYAYEIVILKAPDGFAPSAETFVLPEMGGEIEIRLEKA